MRGNFNETKREARGSNTEGFPKNVKRLFFHSLVKTGIEGIEILAVQMILRNAEGIEETVRVKYFDIYISNAESIRL